LKSHIDESKLNFVEVTTGFSAFLDDVHEALSEARKSASTRTRNQRDSLTHVRNQLPATDKGTGVTSCSLCLETSHNRLTCPRPKPIPVAALVGDLIMDQHKQDKDWVPPRWVPVVLKWRDDVKERNAKRNGSRPAMDVDAVASMAVNTDVDSNGDVIMNAALNENAEQTTGRDVVMERVVNTNENGKRAWVEGDDDDDDEEASGEHGRNVRPRT
jgi:hypothetical protein